MITSEIDLGTKGAGIWPAAYTGAYLYGDHVCGNIYALSPSKVRTTLATGLAVGSAVAMAFGDGSPSQTSSVPTVSHIHTARGNVTATLTVRDPAGLSNSGSVVVHAGNTAPVPTLTTPTATQLFSVGGQYTLTGGDSTARAARRSPGDDNGTADGLWVVDGSAARTGVAGPALPSDPKPPQPRRVHSRRQC